ncbi:Arc family DNA-binding protein [Leisingera caerulea]|nr:Arc family DNA-binding protein [Leisingera caerulea]
MTKRKGKPFQLRLPRDVKEWIERQSETNMSSQNSEIVRAIRAAMSSATDEV